MESKIREYFELVKTQGIYEIDRWHVERPSNIFFEKYLSQYDFKDLQKVMKRLRKEFEKKTYQYIVTFTLNPKYVDLNDKKLLKKIELYIIQRFKRPAICAVRADIVQEGGVGTDKQHHWHVALHSRKWLLKKSFKYYEDLYGFVDINKSTDNNYSNRLNYITKSDTPHQII